MQKRIYIAGKVTGENRKECIEKFGNAQVELEKQGFIGLNPIQLVGDWNTSWKVAMKICICHLMTADAVLLLEDWELSNGAKIEKQLAQDLNIPIFNNTKGSLQVLRYQLAMYENRT